MSEKTINNVIKSTSDGELLEKDVKYANDSSLKRSYRTLSFRQIRKKDKDFNVIEEAEHPKFIRRNSIRQAWHVLRRKFSTLGATNKTGCGDLDSLQKYSQLDVRIPTLKLLPGDKVPGLIGLHNHGNTCFINAVIQCLSHTDPLVEYFVMDQYKDAMTKRKKLTSKKYGTKGEVTEQLAVLLKSIWHREYQPDISYHFKELIDKYGTQYKGSNQHDAQEFLIWLLDKVHEDLNTATKKTYKANRSSFDRSDEDVATETLANHVRCNKSFVHDMFQAQLYSSVTCLKCHKQSKTFDPFLCLSVPIPQQQLKAFYVTVLYISQQPRQVKLGLSLPLIGTVRDLRQRLSSDTGIPEHVMLLTQIDDLGSQHTLTGSQPLAEISDLGPLYCLEMPLVKESDDLEKCLLLCWVNVLILDDHCSRFGSPYVMQLGRLTDYKDLQKLILKEMNMILHDDVLTSDQDIPLFHIKIVDGINSSEVPYLDPTVDHPLYMEEVEQAMALQDEDCGPKHLKLVLEWDIQAKETAISDDSDVVEEHSTVKLVQGVADGGSSVSLKECLDLYTRFEYLGAEDKWHCPSCNRKQQAKKSLGLWSLPNILVVHLKRFRQTSKQQSATKLTALVDCPLHELDMAAYLVKPTNSAPSSVRRLLPAKTSKVAISFEDQIYDLVAVCNHHGSDVQRGHYTAYCRNSLDSQWYLFDDTKVEAVAEGTVISPAAYILFYQRRRNNASSSSTSASSTDHWVNRMPAFLM